MTTPTPSTASRRMASSRFKSKLTDGIAYTFILLFTYASIRVLADYPMFVREVYTLTVFEPVKWGYALICVLELCTVIALIVPRFRLAGFILTFIVMMIVTIASLIVLINAPLIPHLFGGIFPHVDFWGHLYINIFLLFVSLVALLLFLQPGKKI